MKKCWSGPCGLLSKVARGEEKVRGSYPGFRLVCASVAAYRLRMCPVGAHHPENRFHTDLTIWGQRRRMGYLAIVTEYAPEQTRKRLATPPGRRSRTKPLQDAQILSVSRYQRSLCVNEHGGWQNRLLASPSSRCARRVFVLSSAAQHNRLITCNFFVFHWKTKSEWDRRRNCLCPRGSSIITNQGNYFFDYPTCFRRCVVIVRCSATSRRRRASASVPLVELWLDNLPQCCIALWCRVLHTLYGCCVGIEMTLADCRLSVSNCSCCSLDCLAETAEAFPGMPPILRLLRILASPFS